MESVIGLRFSGAPVRIMPSGFHAAARADYKPQFRRLSCSSTSLSLPKLETTAASLSFARRFRLPLSRSSRRCPLDHIVGPVRCTAAQSGCDENCQQKQNKYRDLVHQLLQCQPDHLAVLLKPIVAGGDKRLYNQIIDIVGELKNSKNRDLALKLLKICEECCLPDPQSLDAIRIKIMEILYSDGKYEEAFDYWARLYETESPERRKLPSFQNMQRDLFSSMAKVEECLKKNLSPEKLGSTNDSLPTTTELENNTSQSLENNGDLPKPDGDS